MSKPFKLPSAFKLTKNGYSYQLVIKQINPFFVGLYLIIIISLLIVSIAHSNVLIGALMIVPSVFIIIQFLKTYQITFDEKNLFIEDVKIPNVDILKIQLSRKNKTVGLGVQTGSAQKVTISIVTKNKRYFVAKELIEHNQQNLMFILRKVAKQDFNFIDLLLR